MHIEIIYLHVVSKSDPSAPTPQYYTQFHQRFSDTYRRFMPKLPHKLRVVFCGGEGTDSDRSMYADLNPVWDVYLGQGWDIGAQQNAACKSDADVVLCLGTPAYFWMENWLEHLVAAYKKYDRGLYGPMASYENTPHIRTSAYLFSPDKLRKYPYLIDSREKCFRFESGFTSTGEMHESGGWSFTNWMLYQGEPVLMVTADGKTYELHDWRKPDNIFRRGDQSNCLIRDRHWDLYASSTENDKRTLEYLADGIHRAYLQ